jgi:hypothetical protein
MLNNGLNNLKRNNMRVLIEKLKSFMHDFFIFYWEGTTIRINDREVIELGGFTLIILVFIIVLETLKSIGYEC